MTPTFNDRVVAPEDYGSDEVHQSLAGLSVPAEHARYFGHHLGTNNEGAIVSVTARGRQEEAIDILEENGADIGDDAVDFDYRAAATRPTSARNIQLFGEVLCVHKYCVSRGEARIRKEVSTTTNSVDE
jgi:stress response protein YsnF